MKYYELYKKRFTKENSRGIGKPKLLSIPDPFLTDLIPPPRNMLLSTHSEYIILTGVIKVIES